MHAAPPDHAVRGRPRARVLAALVAATLLLHGGLLGGLQGNEAAAEAPPRRQAMSVRTLQPVVAMAAAPQALPPIQTRVPFVPPSRAAAATLPRRAAAPSPMHVAPAPARDSAEAAPAPPVDTTPAEAVPVEPHVEPMAANLVAAAAAEPVAASVPDLAAAPVYRTQLPPSVLLRYDLRRGLLRGSGELTWRADGQRYELRLDGRVAGLSVLSQTSQGDFDAAGLAPLRFTDQRLRRDRVAANFQRQAGKLSYSGSKVEFPLQPGMQDRLSWMVQLAAIVAADAGLRQPRAHVDLPVTGARGDLSLWVFLGLGIETVDTAAGPRPALRYTREPRVPYDTRVDVWLDPARHHLPLRAAMRNGSDGDALELMLTEMAPLP